jgi:FkbM family methyltransferase
MKNTIKKLLSIIGWKLVKIKRKKTSVHPHPVPTIHHIKSILACKGILHLGAHRGQEAPVYDWFNKKVLWIEAIPEIFDYLNDYLNHFHNQSALCVLLGDQYKNKTNFYISNSDSSCSSIFDFSNLVKEGKLWPDRKFKMQKVLQLEMKTLDMILKEKNIDISTYDHWVLDLQGAELLVLKGAKKSICHCNSIFIEISKDQYYEEGSATWLEIKNFMFQNNFKLIEEPTLSHAEVLFVKSISISESLNE